jgi:hypothetical protein
MKLFFLREGAFEEIEQIKISRKKQRIAQGFSSNRHILNELLSFGF